MQNKHPFRLKHPSRTYTGVVQSNYRNYKTHLIKDFNGRCGYTDCSDRWFGGSKNFHIDHFLPWKQHENHPTNLKLDYSNLVYSCSYVNILKSDDTNTYLDPCNNDLNSHFYRDQHGTIFPNPNSPTAVYMHKKLKMGLSRYQIIWVLDRLCEVKTELKYLIDRLPLNHPRRLKLLEGYFEISSKFDQYFEYLQSEL